MLRVLGAVFGFGMSAYGALAIDRPYEYDTEGKFGGVFHCQITAGAGITYTPWEEEWKAEIISEPESFTITVAQDKLNTTLVYGEPRLAYMYSVMITERGSAPKRCSLSAVRDMDGKYQYSVPVWNNSRLSCGDGFNTFVFEMDGLTVQVTGAMGDLTQISSPIMPTTHFVKAGKCRRM